MSVYFWYDIKKFQYSASQSGFFHSLYNLIDALVYLITPLILSDVGLHEKNGRGNDKFHHSFFLIMHLLIYSF